MPHRRTAHVQESWYEKLNRWDEALDAYERKYAATASNPRAPAHIDAALGRLRCLAALAEWNKLSNVARDEWRRVDPHVQVCTMVVRSCHRYDHRPPFWQPQSSTARHMRMQ
jgi:phosphatidylinositol kinase/protein kinase (PI-3  family)